MRSLTSDELIVLKIGGRGVLGRETLLDFCKIEKSVDAIDKILQGQKRIILIAGGAGAHHFIEPARRLGVTEDSCDAIGSNICDVFSEILKGALLARGHAVYPMRVRTVADVRFALSLYRCVVVGALKEPVTSSDSVAAYIAESVDANSLWFIKAWTLVDRVHGEALCAVSPPTVCVEWLRARIGNEVERAGSRPFFDQACLSILMRMKVPTYLFSSLELEAMGATGIFLPPKSAVQIVGQCADHSE